MGLERGLEVGVEHTRSSSRIVISLLRSKFVAECVESALC